MRLAASPRGSSQCVKLHHRARHRPTQRNVRPGQQTGADGAAHHGHRSENSSANTGGGWRGEEADGLYQGVGGRYRWGGGGVAGPGGAESKGIGGVEGGRAAVSGVEQSERFEKLHLG